MCTNVNIFNSQRYYQKDVFQQVQGKSKQVNNDDTVLAITNAAGLNFDEIFLKSDPIPLLQK